MSDIRDQRPHVRNDRGPSDGSPRTVRREDAYAAVKHCAAGISIWQWASNDQGTVLDVVMVRCGDVPTRGIVGDALFPGGNDHSAKQAGVESIQVRDPNESKRVIEAIIACLGLPRFTTLREKDA